MNTLFKCYIGWLATFNDSFKYDDEVSICEIIRTTVLATIVTTLVIGLLGCMLVITIMPLIELFYNTPNDLFFPSLVWWIFLILTWVNCRVYPKVKKLFAKKSNEYHTPKVNKFELLANDMWYSFKTKTCFKVKIRD